MLGYVSPRAVCGKCKRCIRDRLEAKVRSPPISTPLVASSFRRGMNSHRAFARRQDSGEQNGQWCVTHPGCGWTYVFFIVDSTILYGRREVRLCISTVSISWHGVDVSLLCRGVGNMRAAQCALKCRSSLRAIIIARDEMLSGK